MPSLPELEIYKNHFTVEIVGRMITRVESLDSRVVHVEVATLENLLVNHAIKGIARYGKWLVWDTGASEQLITHLGLTGKLRLLEPETELPKYACLVLQLTDGRRIVLSDQRHLGNVYVRDFSLLKAEKSLGPDLLDIQESYFVTTLAPKHRAVRDILMDQKLIAGIGGKYADEILWQANLNPHTKMSQLSLAQLKHLYRLARDITASAIALNADVDRFSPGWLIPHRHTDKICPRCHCSLTENSSAFYCPRCQPIDQS